MGDKESGILLHSGCRFDKVLDVSENLKEWIWPQFYHRGMINILGDKLP